MSLTTGLRATLRRLPKVELHLHLDGSMRPATALELAAARRLVPPGTDAAALRAQLVAPMPCHDQAELLQAFELPLAILQDVEALERAAAELVHDLAADGIAYAEVRWAPALHTRHGLDLRGVIGAVAAGSRRGMAEVRAAGRETDVRLIVVAMRSGTPAQSEVVARAAVAGMGDGVVGFDLAGPEAAFPDAGVHGRAFAMARAAGLGLTVHAGEWGGARQVRRALALGPDRIAHGAAAIDDPWLLAALRARGITLDLCPTSNWQAGLVARLADHPLPRLVRAGVPVTLSTDDRTVSDLSLTDEYERALDPLGLAPPELLALDRHAVEAAFLAREPVLRDHLASRVADFAAAEAAFHDA